MLLNETFSKPHIFVIPIDNHFFKIGVVLLFIAIFALSSIENILVIVAVWQPRIRYKASGKYSRYLIGNMCLANFFFTIIMVPFTIHFTVADKLFLKTTYAQICGFFVELLTSAMIASIIGITIERLLAVIYPLEYRRCANKPCMLCLSFVGWAISAVIAFIPFIGFIFIKSEPFTFSESFSIFFLISCNSHIFYRFYTIVFCSTSYVIPLIFIIIAYSQMYQFVRHISKDLRQRSLNLNIVVTEDITSVERNEVLNHSMSSPNFITDTSGSFFSSKKTLLEIDNKDDQKRFRKISANSFFKTMNKNEVEPSEKLSRCYSEYQTTKTIKQSLVSTNSSKISLEMSSFIRKGSKMCSKKLKGLFSQKEEIKAAKTCLIVVTAFIFLISPYFILLIIQAFHTEFMEHNILWHTFSVILLYVNCIITPAIYVFRDSVVLCEVKHLWKTCKFKNDSVPVRKPSVRSRNPINNGIRNNIDVIEELEEKHFVFDTIPSNSSSYLCLTGECKESKG